MDTKEEFQIGKDIFRQTRATACRCSGLGPPPAPARPHRASLGKS